MEKDSIEQRPLPANQSDTNNLSYQPQHFTSHAAVRQRQREISSDSINSAIQNGEKLEGAEANTYIDESTQVVMTKEGTVITLLENKRNTRFDISQRTKSKEESLLKKVERNNDYAMCELAELYLSGELGSREVKKAHDLLLRAATRKQNSHAMCLLSQLYDSGDLGEPNPKASLEWLEKAAKRKNKYASAVMGQRLLAEYLKMKAEGKIDEKKKSEYQKKINQFFQTGAQKGGTRAMWHQAKIEEEGYFGEKNLSKAIAIYTKASELGSPSSLESLQSLVLENKFDADIFEAILEKASQRIAKTSSELAVDIGLKQIQGLLGRKPSRGFQMIEKAAQNRNESAIEVLAKCYRDGKGCERNLEHSQHWFAVLKNFYEKAAKEGNNDALWKLGFLYLKGAFGKIELEEAEKIFKQAALRTDNIAYIEYLGRLYLTGQLGNKDPSLGLVWIDKTIAILTERAHKGDSEAATSLSEIFLDEELGFKDYPKAAEWLNFLAQKGKAKARLTLAELTLKKKLSPANIFEVIKSLESVIDKMPSDFTSRTLRILGDLHNQINNYKGAALWFEKAAKEFENSKAMCRLGTLHKSDVLGKVDLSKAIEWYGLAYKKGHKKARQFLEELLQSKELASELKTTIESLLSSPIESEEPSSEKPELIYKRAKQYLEDLQDILRAAYYFQKGARYGHTECCYELAKLFESGQLGEKVCSVAVVFYKRAAKEDHSESIKALERIFKEGLVAKPNPIKAESGELKETPDSIKKKELPIDNKKIAYFPSVGLFSPPPHLPTKPELKPVEKLKDHKEMKNSLWNPNFKGLKNKTVMKETLNTHCDLEEKNPKGNTPLLELIHNLDERNLNTLLMLIKAGCNLEVQDGNGSGNNLSQIIAAHPTLSIQAKEKIEKTILELKRAKEQKRLLVFAVNEGYYDQVLTAIEQGEDINQQTGKNQNTPLMIALIRKEFYIAQLLMDKKADLTPRNKQKLDAIEYARQLDIPEHIIESLFGKTMKPDSPKASTDPKLSSTLIGTLKGNYSPTLFEPAGSLSLLQPTSSLSSPAHVQFTEGQIEKEEIDKHADSLRQASGKL
jgi:TPR repeat protein